MHPAPPYYSYWGKTAGGTSGDGDRRYHLLAYHQLAVAAVGDALLRRDERLAARLAATAGLGVDDLRALIVAWLSVHDIGKFAPSFQGLAPDVVQALGRPPIRRPYSVRHDSLGFLLWDHGLLPRLLGNLLRWHGEGFSLEDIRDLTAPMARAAMGHHGRPPKPPPQLALHQAFPPEELVAAEAYVRDVAVVTPWPALDFPCFDEDRFAAFAWLLAGLATVCDWIGSSEEWFRFISDVMPLGEYWGEARSRADAALESSGILIPGLSTAPPAALFPHLAKPTPLQQYAHEVALPVGPQCHVLEDDTGSGKTEAGLLLARRIIAAGYAQGIFIGLPTMATANAMYDRLIPLFPSFFDASGGPASFVLTHSARKLREWAIVPTDPATPESGASLCAAWLSDNRKKALLAAFGVGTIDQALVSVLPSTHQSLRLLGLSRSVLLVDEVHAYDSYMQQELARLLEFQAAIGGSAVLLSATLPRHVRDALQQAFGRGLGAPVPVASANYYPQAALVAAGGASTPERSIEPVQERCRTVEVAYISDQTEVQTRIAAAVAGGQCVCWVRNTVRDAIGAYESLASSLPTGSCSLFHARFAMGDRLAIEREVLRSFGFGSRDADRRGRVLVATQVVEQSLDLDFDLMVSDLAPIDLLLQRAGRLQRHRRQGRRPAPVLIVLGPAFTEAPGEGWYSAFSRGAAMVYPHHGRLWLTAQLCQRRSWTLPETTRELIDAVYSPERSGAVPPGLAGADLTAHGADRAAAGRAMQNTLRVASGYAVTAAEWLADTTVPTRLGELTSVLRLVRRTATGYSPWCADSRHPWAMSEVSVAARVAAVSDLPESELSAVQSLMPDAGRWSITVCLEESSGGSWTGSATTPADGAKPGGRTAFHYDPTLGLQWDSERGDA